MTVHEGPIEPAESLEVQSIAGQRQDSATMQIMEFAQRNPRNFKKCLDEAITLVTMDKETAEECFYAVPRDGNSIAGPSIRLAEIIQYAFKFIVVESWIVREERNIVVAAASATDLQNLSRVSAEAVRGIRTSKGDRYSPDMIRTTMQAAMSVAIRNAIFRIIPRPYVRPVVEAALNCAAGGEGSHEDRVREIVAYLVEQGVSEERILAALDVPSVNNILISGVVTMRAAARQVKAGESSFDRIFPEIGKEQPNRGAAAADGEAAIKTAKEAMDKEKPKAKKAERPNPSDVGARLAEVAMGRLIADGEAENGDEKLEGMAAKMLTTALGLAGFTSVEEIPDEETVRKLAELILTGTL